MRAALLSVALLLISPAAALAQVVVPANARLEWDHPRTSTSRFETRVDTGPAIDVGLPATNVWIIPALTPGNHDLSVRACNAAGCSAWVTLGVQSIVVPAVPTNLRLGAAVINQARVPRGVPDAPTLK